MQALKRHGAFAILVVGIVLLAVWLWLFGGAAALTQWAAQEQRDVQAGLAGSLRAARAGEPWAGLGLLGLCFAYGFFHAAGPGHGKLVMGGYALGEDVPRGRIIALTLAGSLGQAVTAIVVVSIGAAVFGWGRAQMTELADGSLAVVSAVGILLVGLWLFWRGVRRFSAAQDMHVPHGHDHGGVCGSCGHVHGPTAEQVAGAQTWRSGLAVILAVAARPCTGALFVLILTFGMGIPTLGILGAIVMGLGTAMLTLLVGLGAWHLRGGLSDRLSGSSGLRAMGILESVAGLTVAVIAGQVALRLISVA